MQTLPCNYNKHRTNPFISIKGKIGYANIETKVAKYNGKENIFLVTRKNITKKALNITKDFNVKI